MITMPTRKPDVVTEHRVTLGRWERENIQALNEAKIVKDVGVGVGIATLGIGGTYVAYKIGKAIHDWGENAVDFLTEQPTNDDGDKGPPRWVRWLVSFGP